MDFYSWFVKQNYPDVVTAMGQSPQATPV
jgi:hypothetical protein